MSEQLAWPRKLFRNWRDSNADGPEMSRAVFAVLGVLFVASVGSLVIWPLPSRLVAGYVLVGAFAGALCLLREEFWSYLGVGVLIFGQQGVTAYGERAFSENPMLIWQAGLIPAFIWMATASVVPWIRHRTRQAPQRTARSAGPPVA